MNDSFATPIDALPSLPAPIMQSKQDMQRVGEGAALSYTDILKNLEVDSHPAVQRQASPNQPPQAQQWAPQAQTQGAPDQYPQQQWAPQEWVPQQQQQQAQQTPSWDKSFFQENHKMIFVAIIFFVVFSYIVPRIKTYLPQVVQDGTLTTAGIGALSILSGLLYQVSDKYFG